MGGARPRHANEVFVQRCSCIPMRLDREEREQLGTLISALKVSEYTDEIDTLSRRNKPGRVVDAIHDVCAIASGLAICSNPSRGRKLVGDHDHAENERFFQGLFELGRRHKIMNPSRMRGEYGKLMYMLQDASNKGTRETLGFSCMTPLKMVSTFLEQKGAADLLWDARILAATGYDSEFEPPTRAGVDAVVAAKNDARESLIKDWASSELSEDAVRLCISSIDDARCYERFNVAPVDAVLKLLEDNFDHRGRTVEKPASLSLCGDRPIMSGSGERSARKLLQMGGSPDDDDDEDDLPAEGSPMVSRLSNSALSNVRNTFGAISGGLRGFMNNGNGYNGSIGGSAKLNHDHSTQYTFVRQSLLLWREIMRNMFRLWVEADSDLLESSGGAYQLWNTGQGLNRVQRCPRVAAEMRRILTRVQRESNQPWVGLSVVHLGDRDVPNALVFIDKYTQVPRLLAPLATVLESLEGKLLEEPAVAAYVDSIWGGLRGLKLTILSDFFKHAFDGDGDDGGSCIDGRLTSAWNWSAHIAKKPYYPIFLMAGFQGFDGDFREED